jgi:hypothetical protein
MEETEVKRAIRAHLYRPSGLEPKGLDHTLLLTLGETAASVDRGRLTLRRLISKRKLGSYKIGQLLVPIEEVERLRPFFRACQSARMRDPTMPPR